MNRLHSEPACAAVPMSYEQLDNLIRQIGEKAEGWHGFWQMQYSGRDLICVADELHDRMRVMTSIVHTSEISADQLTECLEANFDRALDARYCVSDEMVWAAFLHPLQSLTPGLFRSACQQVVQAADNFGRTYCSTSETKV